MSAFLKVSDMEFAYGEVTVLRGLDLEVEEGTISCVMGRNGVGKTTFLRNVVGLEKSSAGNVLMDGTDITQMEAYERACLLYTSPSPRDVEESRMPSSA